MTILVLIIACLIVIWLVLLCRSKRGLLEGLSGNRALVVARISPGNDSINSYWMNYAARMLNMFNNDYELDLAYIVGKQPSFSVVAYPDGRSGKAVNIMNTTRIYTYRGISVLFERLSKALGITMNPDQYRTVIVAELPECYDKSERAIGYLLMQLTIDNYGYLPNIVQPRKHVPAGSPCIAKLTIYPTGMKGTSKVLTLDADKMDAKDMINAYYTVLGLPNVKW